LVVVISLLFSKTPPLSLTKIPPLSLTKIHLTFQQNTTTQPNKNISGTLA
jgi:hypothetical protein